MYRADSPKSSENDFDSDFTQDYTKITIGINSAFDDSLKLMSRFNLRFLNGGDFSDEFAWFLFGDDFCFPFGVFLISYKVAVSLRDLEQLWVDFGIEIISVHFAKHALQQWCLELFVRRFRGAEDHVVYN